MPKVPAWWTVAEVAARWHVAKVTIYRYIHNRQIAATHIDGSYRIPDWEVRDEHGDEGKQ